MRNIRNIYVKMSAALLTVSLLGSCAKTLDILPKDQIDASQALTASAGVRASIANIYSTLKGENFYGNRLIGLPEALADNGQATNKSGRYINEARNTPGSHFSNWSGAYVALNRINIVLEALPSITDASAAQKDAWEGELRFLRALYHFDVLRAYAYIPGAVIASQDKGGIPLSLTAINTADGAINASTPRLSREEAYAAIYADLDIALTKAPELTTTVSTYTANKQAARALYSRVALYNKDFAKVVSLSNDLITARGATLLNTSNYVAGFAGKSNPESLFEISYTIESEGLGVNLGLQTLFTTIKARQGAPKRDQTETTTDPKFPSNENAGFGDLVPTSTLLADLGIVVTNNGGGTIANPTTITSRSADVRNALFEVGSVRRGNIYVECTKFLGRNGWVNVDNVPVFRIAEAYLNRAEAYAEAGTQQNQILALQDVNTIRVARGLTPLVGVVGPALINEIMLQRRLEFAFEGHRFFDLKRRGLNINKPASNTTLLFENYAILPSIPVGDVDASKGKIPQNFGY